MIKIKTNFDVGRGQERKNVIYFHSAVLLTKTGFVQKTRPEITEFSKIHKNLSFH
jgi:hypothetical protein